MGGAGISLPLPSNALINKATLAIFDSNLNVLSLNDISCTTFMPTISLNSSGIRMGSLQLSQSVIHLVSIVSSPFFVILYSGLMPIEL